ncbi:MAG: GNAT family N-acetyltransferase [Peptococcaceae bacterium]|nr:GNAT family N-acetyltransferase [Peptococcaceae bacterium]
MKKRFEGRISSQRPEQWDERTKENELLRSAVLEAAAHSDTPFLYVEHPAYICCEYKMKLNIFTFGKLRLRIPMTVVGLPASFDKSGFSGSIGALAADYQNRGGLALLLNLESTHGLPAQAAVGETLCSCIFYNRFSSFEEYERSLRSGYRRRIHIADAKGADLRLARIPPEDYSDETHTLYLNVYRRSKYPLEELRKEFFRTLDAEIYVFYHGGVQAAFFCIKEYQESLHFVFGGMDYALRDRFDLYYNMLIAIIRIGISRGCHTIDLGQTAEDTKCRLGCVTEKRYMALLCRSRATAFILRRLAPLLAYRPATKAYNVYK